MSSTVYLNGAWLEKSQARVSVEDRGFMFADGVYEVVRYYNGHPVAMDLHLGRLRESLRQISLEVPRADLALDRISAELVRRNEMPDAVVYWQITRGVAPRAYPFPGPDCRPTVLAMLYPAEKFRTEAGIRSFGAALIPDQRWLRCSIKSIALLAGVLDTQEARSRGAQAAILYRNGMVTEASSAGVMGVRGRVLVTHPADGLILDSVTRRLVIGQAHEAGFKVVEQPFSVEEIPDLDEMFLVGTTTEIAAVTQVDERPVGAGVPGPVSVELFGRLRSWIAGHCRIES